MASVANLPNRKRARPSNASNNTSRRQAADDASRPLKRSRPSNSAAAAANTASNSRSSAAALLRGPNPNVARNRIGGGQEASSRPSLQDVTPSQIQNKPPPPRRRSGQTKPIVRRAVAPAQASGRSGATQRQRQHQQQESSPDEQPVARSRRRVGEEQDEEEEGGEASDVDDQDEDEDVPPSPEKPFAHVAPFTRRVRQSTIETKWSPLGRGSLKALTSILQLAHRPILQRLAQSSESRRAPTEAALRLITKRVLDKDGGRETELNFESVLDAKQTLERQLDPVLHAVDLLSAETRRVEEELEEDYEKLRLLEAEVRTRARENRSLLKKAHVLAPESASTTGGMSSAEEGGVKFEKKALNPFQSIEDDEIRDMISTLGGHVDRIQSNTAQTAGVGDQIERTRAALQAVLARKLGAQTYEHVVLGR
ncbi:hypothetical protein LEL_09654 [Akanthomyces lecanii RCEF 1005]|uniref:Kinetochore protein fta7 n=1 Tax=Akanthomyces lecanii RCEF 1005 TaxID=1081108 RepID=A0A168C840_CORDF|nr:hypothetical protein LEL_09654 [Akanthomyces lecanii RCEF 1005]